MQAMAVSSGADPFGTNRRPIVVVDRCENFEVALCSRGVPEQVRGNALLPETD